MLGAVLMFVPIYFIAAMFVFPFILASMTTSNPSVFLAFMAMCAIVSITLAWVYASMSPTAAKTWRKILITIALLCFSLPIAGMVLSGAIMHAASDGNTSSNLGAAAGAALGTGFVGWILGIIGFFVGGIFLIIGLLVGRDPRIVYVQQAPPPPSPPQR